MPRPKSANPPVDIHLRIPPEVYVPAAAILYSPLEQRVPYGAMNRLVITLLKDWLQKQSTNPAN